MFLYLKTYFDFEIYFVLMKEKIRGEGLSYFKSMEKKRNLFLFAPSKKDIYSFS